MLPLVLHPHRNCAAKPTHHAEDCIRHHVVLLQPRVEAVGGDLCRDKQRLDVGARLQQGARSNRGRGVRSATAFYRYRTASCCCCCCCDLLHQKLTTSDAHNVLHCERLSLAIFPLTNSHLQQVAQQTERHHSIAAAHPTQVVALHIVAELELVDQHGAEGGGGAVDAAVGHQDVNVLGAGAC